MRRDRMLERKESEALARRDLERAREYARKAVGEATVKAYRLDWSDFLSWCLTRGAQALPASPAAVGAYIAHLADQGRKPSTIRRRLASISVAHKTAGHPSPTGDYELRKTLEGIENDWGKKGAPKRRVSPVRARHLKSAVQELSGVKGARDKALILIGYAGAFRRSEMVSLKASDLRFQEEGVLVTLRRSKTDQKGEGHAKAIGYGSNVETCPVRALRAWMLLAGLEGEDPLFPPIRKGGAVMKGQAMTDRAVALIIKDLAGAMGLEAGDVSGHSLRAGFVTDGYAKDLPEAVIAQQTGHKSRQILGIYRREADLFAVNCSAKVGL